MFWVHKVMDELNECGLGYGLSGLYTQNVMEFIQNQIIAIRAGSKIHHKTHRSCTMAFVINFSW